MTRNFAILLAGMMMLTLPIVSAQGEDQVDNETPPAGCEPIEICQSGEAPSRGPDGCEYCRGDADNATKDGGECPDGCVYKGDEAPATGDNGSCMDGAQGDEQCGDVMTFGDGGAGQEAQSGPIDEKTVPALPLFGLLAAGFLALVLTRRN